MVIHEGAETNKMKNIANAIIKSAQPGWTEWISIILSIIMPITVLYVQRYFDQKRQSHENKPLISLGQFESYGKKLNLGKYWGADIDINKNPLFKSKIVIPVYNIGKTPISGIHVTYEVMHFKQIVEGLPNEPLPFTQSDQKEIYFLGGTLDEPKYIVSTHKDGLGGGIKVKSGGDIKNVHFPDRTVETINAGWFGECYLEPMVSGSRKEIILNNGLELFIQYILFMNGDRSHSTITDNNGQKKISCSGDVSLTEPTIKITFAYIDYLGKKHQENKYAKLRTPKLHSVQSFSAEKGLENYSESVWEITPIANEEVDNSA